MRFGRVQSNPYVFLRAPCHRFALEQAPQKLDRSGVAFTPGLYHNDDLPDCTAVALANVARGVAALQGFDYPVNADHVTAFYADSASIPNTPEAIEASGGTEIINTMKRQALTGLHIGAQTPLVANYGFLAVTRINLALALNRLGPVYVGAMLRERDMGPEASVWDVDGGRDDGNVVGGHAFILWDYDGLAMDSKVRVGTWGAWKEATWGWVSSRIDEAWGLVYRQAAKEDGSFWNGLKVDDLTATIAGGK